MDSNVVKREIEISAPISKVWRAITDHTRFGSWFEVKLEQPFVVGKVSSGPITSRGHEHLRLELTTVTLQPETVFAFSWHPYAVDPEVDYSGETPTLVELTLSPKGSSTLVTVTESGFDALPPHRRGDALKMNGAGWEEQLRRVKAYVDAGA